MSDFLEYQVYPEEYFSGSDISIYFGDVWVDDIMAFSFTLAESAQPIFGYNSYTYDYLMRGTRRIQGTLAIAFKEANYLNNVTASVLANSSRNALQIHPYDRGKAQVLLDKAYDKKTLSQLLATSNPDDVQSIARQLQQAAGWETSPEATPFGPYFKGGPDGFTIVVMYGSYIKGSKDKNTPLKDLLPYTRHILKGVQLVSKGSDIDSDGTPVIERYGFIARDMEP